MLSYIYVLGQLVAIGFLGTGLSAALVFLARLPFSEKLDKVQVDRLACDANLKGCSACYDDTIEW